MENGDGESPIGALSTIKKGIWIRHAPTAKKPAALTSFDRG